MAFRFSFSGRGYWVNTTPSADETVAELFFPLPEVIPQASWVVIETGGDFASVCKEFAFRGWPSVAGRGTGREGVWGERGAEEG